MEKNHYIDLLGRAYSAYSAKDDACVDFFLLSHSRDPQGRVRVYRAVDTCWEKGYSCLVPNTNNFLSLCFKLGLTIGPNGPTEKVIFFEGLGYVFWMC